MRFCQYMLSFSQQTRTFLLFSITVRQLRNLRNYFVSSPLYHLDKLLKKLYNTICTSMRSYGAAKVSTGVLRYDKRGGQDNPVKMSNLNNKRQQYCCSCSVSCDAALTPPVPRERTTTPAVRQISSEHEPRVAPVSVMHQGATKSGSLSVGVRMREA